MSGGPEVYLHINDWRSAETFNGTLKVQRLEISRHLLAQNFWFLYLDVAAVHLEGGRCSRQSRPGRSWAGVSWELPVTTITHMGEDR